MNRYSKYILPFVLGLTVISCEKGKDATIDTTLTAPFVTSVTLYVSAVNLDDTSTNSHLTKLPNSLFNITDTVSASIANADGGQDLRQVYFRIYAPGSTNYFLSGTLSAASAKKGDSSSADYRGTLSFTLSRSDIGIYTIEVYALNNGNQTSNYVQSSLIISRNNSAPRTSNIVAPDTIVRPSIGTQLFSLSILVADSDGYGDIDLVFFKRISPPSANLFLLYDDGDVNIHGDQLAGDGMFSRIISIDQTALLGDQVFVFLARDKSGAISDSLKHTITIVP